MVGLVSSKKVSLTQRLTREVFPVPASPITNILIIIVLLHLEKNEKEGGIFKKISKTKKKFIV